MKLALQIIFFSYVMLCSSQALDWSKRYKAFDANVPSKELEPIIAKIFETKLPDLEIKESGFVEALDMITLALRSADGRPGMSFIVRGGDSKVKVKISKGTITFGDALDSICVQAGYKWDFPPGGKLTITRDKKRDHK